MQEELNYEDRMQKAKDVLKSVYDATHRAVLGGKELLDAMLDPECKDSSDEMISFTARLLLLETALLDSMPDEKNGTTREDAYRNLREEAIIAQIIFGILTPERAKRYYPSIPQSRIDGAATAKEKVEAAINEESSAEALSRAAATLKESLEKVAESKV